MLKAGKLAALRAAEAMRVSTMLRNSRWRSERLMILGYHGFSLNDEHQWEPGLYMELSLLRRRFDFLRHGGFAVLPLDEGIRRLRDGTLPPRAVSLTFDDGTREFAVAVLPLLREYGFPATVYLTTFYCQHQVPVFDTMCRYLLWMGRDQTFDPSWVGLEARPVPLQSPAVRADLFARMRRLASDRDFGWQARNEMLARIASHLGVDYEALSLKGVMSIMTPEQVAALPEDLVDVQLHTHRHRTPLDRTSFIAEVVDNRRVIQDLRPRGRIDHFCYPSGVTHPEFLPWLRDAEVRSATTCESGLASQRDDLLMLPRLIDSNNVPEPVFQGWMDGTAAFLPRRGASPLAARSHY